MLIVDVAVPGLFPPQGCFAALSGYGLGAFLRHNTRRVSEGERLRKMSEVEVTDMKNMLFVRRMGGIGTQM